MLRATVSPTRRQAHVLLHELLLAQACHSYHSSHRPGHKETRTTGLCGRSCCTPGVPSWHFAPYRAHIARVRLEAHEAIAYVRRAPASPSVSWGGGERRREENCCRSFGSRLAWHHWPYSTSHATQHLEYAPHTFAWIDQRGSESQRQSVGYLFNSNLLQETFGPRQEGPALGRRDQRRGGAEVAAGIRGVGAMRMRARSRMNFVRWVLATTRAASRRGPRFLVTSYLTIVACARHPHTLCMLGCPIQPCLSVMTVIPDRRGDPLS